MKTNQTISFTSTAPAAASVGGATYTPDRHRHLGPGVTITVDGSSTGCSINAGVVSFQTPGTCVLDANQAGNASYYAAPQVQQTFTVAKGNQTITLHLDGTRRCHGRRRHLHRGGHRLARV